MSKSSDLNVTLNQAPHKDEELIFPQELSPSELLNFLKLSTELAADEVFWMKPDSEILYVNNTACEKLGYKRSELIGMRVWDWDPLFPKDVWPTLWAELKQKKHIEFESKHQTKDGVIFPVFIRGHHIPYGDEGVLFAYVTDISEKVEQEAKLKQVNEQIQKEVAIKTQELEQSNHRYDIAVEGTDVGLWSWNIETDETYWSAKFYELLGFDNGEIEASFDAWKQRLHQDDQIRVLRALEAHLNEHQKYDLEFRLRCKDNQYRWFRGKGKAEFGASEKPDHMFGSLESIQEQKALKAAYEFEQEKFKKFVNLAPIGIAINRFEDGAFEYVNDEFSHFTGYSVDELNQLDYWEITPKKYAEEEQQQLTDMIETGRYGPYQKEYIHKAGHLYPVLLSGIKISGLNGKDYIWSVVQDITKQKDIEKQLHRAKEESDANSFRMQLANDSAGIGVWEWDIKTNDLVWDEWMYRLYGVSEELFSGAYEAWEKSVHPEDLQETKTLLQDAIQGTAIYDTEFRIVRPDGVIRTMKASAEVITDEQGNALKVVGVNYDLTEKIEALETLAVAKQEAEKANRAKSDFLANMSHEIRTPMNAILGCLQLFKNAKLDNELSTILDNASFSAQSLLTIINDILDYSKIESNKLTLEQAPFSFEQILDSVKYDLDALASNKGIDFLFYIDDKFHDGWLGDLVRVKQVLLNLVSNAVKFTHKGAVSVSVSSTKLNSKEAIRVVVIDSGIGMSEDAQKRIFDRFSQADSSTSRQYGGTGLGMSITVSLVKLMGGEISLKSEVNKGTEVSVILPLERSNVEHSSQKQESVMPPDLSGMKILVAEDNKINQVLIRTMLKPCHAAVTLVENGLQAVNLVKNTAFDLVLMDIHMPEMDGVEAQRLIKSLDQSLPVVALTANVMSKDVQSYLQQGFVSHVGKPIDINNLYGVLKVLCADN
ncbi:hypothetical protein N474_20480 [Pseudoalteromonas luteoviolacea CPMOR-2]|uniref:Sensory/regulatory protein RpfC n=1 Tax=Pseudoalteromonas luteoviolacea DSM 6061 TaxID=1365250 RepID=A0A166YYS6_9GAMM|nr:PAS domain-containing hybrid sensor histidine kinase/response regulator [Pseudoalteromonas luteoviolacea]KZN43641.1 hypothetical protein N475_08710 [Pseudoalteromonas luteoviolacea DSM 6061]KZN53712.1 hypothetical protein N474_20480 [Pseudoalteromonas luteoviolacea CPMOR-2]MBE0386475.1 hypothetical protein [Pseudoalteromonas luteoviolacea DSM 6061]